MLPAGICTYVAHQHDEGHRPAGHGIIRDLSFPLGPKGGNSLTASSKTLHLFGIKACDTMKKARTWLDEHGVSYEFHDYKTAGIDREHLTQWCNEHGWQVVLNRAGTTFRKLEDERKADLDQSKAIELMLAQPSMIKRPVLDLGDRTLIGFKPDSYSAALK